MVRKANLENLAKGARPALHAAEPNWDMLNGLGDIVDVSEGQVEATIADAQALLDDVFAAFPGLRRSR